MIQQIVFTIYGLEAHRNSDFVSNTLDRA